MKKLTSELHFHIRNCTFKLKEDFPVLKNLYVVSHHHFETVLLVTISLLDCGFLMTWQEMGNPDTIQLLPPPRKLTQIRQWTRFPIQQVFLTRGDLPLKVAKIQAMFEQLTLCTLRSVYIISILFSLPFQRSWQGEFVKLSRASLTGDQFLHSHDRNIWFRDDIVGRN